MRWSPIRSDRPRTARAISSLSSRRMNTPLGSAAIVDKNARIGKNVVIHGCRTCDDLIEGDGWVLRDGIILILKDAVIPDGTVIDFSKHS